VVRIHADIHLEKESQKAIVIGRGGEMLKKIGTRARLAIEAFLGARVHLMLNVVVTKGWTKNPGEMKRLGYFVREI
jgi:GTP-binding protein Era